ncbi:hypothetical protein [Saccharothrix texasensis]|uniref:DoxX-like protein n=1 Tax=Saccharothrix texasensis TaxID=103734 RepID=A0A3N1HJ15_9PSEU|nr:hypothetical protein [Saccharothrix texasensis]ROP42479.1 hypothetical protein EDD40_7982 [Saccharothrix texasensis]
MDTRVVLRVGCALLVLVQVAVGLWAALAPEGFFSGYPTPEVGWVALYPPYNEHLVRDYGMALLQLAPLALVCLKRPEPVFVAALLAGVLLFHLPHAVFHELHVVRTDDLVWQRLALWSPVVIAAALLWPTWESARSRRPPTTAPLSPR